ncbi:MAG: bifunctional diaminohydroxyphosphoribosylaminopyrimidine deaminase/5-amino-6-(5-phosphoribosylamino)uracil reductase RibD [Prevotella sp.]|nr:bifunctional diaminohydroxyphosphoribosylaminopyrimidine deaminase/5-amino-6-(5-phosphoribosylamino)uracil reductase RibD [Prevotella sp.]
MNQKAIDEKYMRRCLQLAKNGRQNARPNPMVGAVIAYKGRIIGEGYHIRCGESHAEVNAFASVSSENETFLADSTLYVSLEPCSHFGKTPPCADLIVQKGVKRVVVGCVDPFAKVQGRGIEKLRNAGIEVAIGILEKECQWLNRRFFTFHREHRPYIILKWAQTQNHYLDDHFRPLSISTPFTKMLSHQLRSKEDAILVGRITDEREHPQLNVRDWSGQDPTRFVLSHETPIESILQDCYERGLQSLIVEGGTRTLQSFLDADLWDEIRVETAPVQVLDGTKAPEIPADTKVLSREMYDKNIIIRYKKDR